MEHRPARIADIATIWSSLAKRTVDEFANAGFSVGQARGLFRDLAKAGTADAILHNGAVIAIMGWTMSEDGLATSFAGTDEFFEPSHVRPFRRYLDRLQESNGSVPMVSHSFSEHPRVAKWFATLGFELRSTKGVHRLFVRPPAVPTLR